MRQFLDGKITLHAGDCRDVIRSLPDASVDSIVTDPPYALVSIVKRFGKEGSAPVKSGDAYSRASAGFMGKQWDTGEAAFATEFWAECLRVLKPGGHVAAFSGTRTYHRLAIAIEDAGFEIRDQLAWTYGSGFPKSHDVSKAIDKAKGLERSKVRVENPRNPKATGGGRDGMKGATRPWIEAAIERGYHEAVSDEAVSDEAVFWQGWGTALKPAWEPICLARKPLIGPVAANVLAHGTGAINVDGCRVGTEGGTSKSATVSVGGHLNAKAGVPIDAGRFPANILHDGSSEVVSCFPNEVDGSAARFFYSAKADASDRIGSKHPTVKPVDLMQWLCRLITPPGGLVLDPFAGTGTTGEAAFREGFRAILIEREKEYRVDIARRMSLAMSGQEERARESLKAKGAADYSAGPLFGGADFAGGVWAADLREVRRPKRQIGPIGLKR